MEQIQVRYRLSGDRALDGWLPEHPESWWDELAEIGLGYSYKSSNGIEVHFDFARANNPWPLSEQDARQLVETKMTALGLSFEYLGAGAAESQRERVILLSVNEREQLQRLVAKLAG